MRKLNILTFILSIFINYKCSADNTISDLKLNNLNGKVKSVTETETFGSLLEQTSLKKVIYYDKNGYIEKIENYNCADGDTMKIGDYIIYKNNIKERKSYKITTTKDTIEEGTYSYSRKKITITTISTNKDDYNSHIVYKLDNSNKLLKKISKLKKNGELIVNNILTVNYNTNGEINSYTVQDKLNSSTSIAKLKNLTYDKHNNILTFLINDDNNTTYSVKNSYQYY